MVGKKSKKELELENRLLKKYSAKEGFVSVVNNLIKYGFFAFGIYCITESVNALAGQDTSANFIVNILANLNINQYLGYAIGGVFGGGGVMYGLKQKKLKQNTVEQMQQRTIDLETQVDPERSSSNLTTTGETRKDDK